jgi:hypothetical protein
MMKCWTPEQDLDESSSDFDHDNDPILPPVQPNPPKPSSTSSKCNLFEGKRASAVVSDSDSKYYGGSTSKSSDELNSRRYHGRGGKSWENPSKKRFNNNNTPKSHNINNPPPQRKSSSNIMHSNGFVGLDTNWFLSRSEPNSLNYVGLSPTDFRKQVAPAPPKKPKKKQQQMLQGKTRATSNNNNNLSNDEFECELELGDEEEDSSDTFLNKQNNNKERKSNSGKKKQQRSEIGYGPSSMNFNNSSSYEDQEEEIQVEEEEEEEELMRDDLFDYLDQYEEGEFEREQELTGGDKKHNGDEVDNNNRPFSHHIMYLPSYDTRKVFGGGSSSGEGWRRTRSVDHLDSGEPTALFRREVDTKREKILHIQV